MSTYSIMLILVRFCRSLLTTLGRVRCMRQWKEYTSAGLEEGGLLLKIPLRVALKESSAQAQVLLPLNATING